jgi:hypothetical protein
MWKIFIAIWNSLIRMKQTYLTFPCQDPTTHSIEILIFFKLAA